MRRFLTILFLLLSTVGMSQTYNMSATPVTTCSGTFYDSGGSGSNYGNNLNITQTFTPSTAGDMLQFNFTSFSTESGYDDLTIYDGPNTSSPLIGVYDASELNGVTITATNTGALTFVFYSDGGVTYSGWVASISCVPPPDCYWEICLEDSYGDGWNGASVDITVGGVFYDNATCTGYGPDCFNIPIVDGDDIDITFNSGSYDSECEWYLYDDVGGLAHSEVGSPSNYTENNASCVTCSEPASVTASSDITTASPGETVIFDYDSHTGGVCSGNWEYEWRDDVGTVLQSWSTTSSYSEVMGGVGTYDYYLYMRCSDCPATSTQSNLVTVTVAICITCSTAEPVGAIPYSYSGTTCGMCDNYSSSDACGSSYMNGDDFLFEYTPASDITLDVDLTTDATWVGVLVTNGCPSTGTCVGTFTSTGSSTSGQVSLTAGNTYYFTVSTYPSPQCINNFTIDITIPCDPPTSVTATTSNTLPAPGESVDFTYVSHSGGNCPSGVWEYEWRDDVGTVLQSWSTTSTYTEVVSTLGNYTYYLYMRCQDCPASTKQSNAVNFQVANCTNCANAEVIGSMPYSFSGSTCGACDNYSSSDACASSYLNGDDYVFEYTPSSTQLVNVDLSTDATWVGVVITDGCPDVGSCVSAITSSTSSASGQVSLTGGVTYYFTVSTYPSPQCINNFTLDLTVECAPIFTLSQGSNNCPTGTEYYIDVNITSLGTAATVEITNDGGASTISNISATGTQSVGPFSPGTTVNIDVTNEADGTCTDTDVLTTPGNCPPSNDNCSGAISLTVNADELCGTTTSGTVEYATASGDANNCFGTDDDDVWYSFVATQSNHTVDLLNVAGSVTDMYISVFEGSCGSLGNAIKCSDPNSTEVTGLTVGNTYYVRIYTYTSTGGQNTDFDICIGTPPPTGPCGNPLNNDWCDVPATLTYSPGSTWSSTTSSLFSDDEPANLGSIFCGSIENNSWYEFTASNTTETFNFTNITNCNFNDGIQAEVYEVTTDVNGCCTGFSSVSNCWNPMNTNDGTVTATGLTIGNNYILMVDGWAGDECDFMVLDWEADGILPVSLVSLDYECYGNDVVIEWSTATEINNDYFAVQRSGDAINWHTIEVISGTGNSNERIDYEIVVAYDPDYRYFRLLQVDFDGTETYSPVVSANCDRYSGMAIVPNPTDNSSVRVVGTEDGDVIRVFDVNGAEHENEDLAPGTYAVFVNQAFIGRAVIIR